MSEVANVNQGEVDNENQQNDYNATQQNKENSNVDEKGHSQQQQQIKENSQHQSQNREDQKRSSHKKDNESEFILKEEQQIDRYEDAKYMRNENIDNVEKLFDTQSNPSNRSQTKNNQQQLELQQQSQNINILNNNNIHEFYQKRKERQQAEKDGEILANRIALLKQEEIRTLKKIEETRKKALEVYYLKLKNESRQKKKKELKQNKTLYSNNNNVKKGDQIQNKQQYQQKTTRRKSQIDDDRVIISKNEFNEQKKGNFQKIKEISKYNEDQIKRNKEQYIKNARDKKIQISQAIETGKQRVQEFYEFKKYLIRQEIDEKLRQEEQQKYNKLNEIKRMEDYEIELIQRLKSTQNMQQNAYEELENALMMNAQDFATKYLNQEEDKQLNLDQSNQSRIQASKSQPNLRQQNDEFPNDNDLIEENQGTQTIDNQ